MRDAELDELISQVRSQGEEYLRRAQYVHAAAGARGAHVAEACGPHHAGAWLARRHTRVSQATLGRKTGVKALIGTGPGGAKFEADGPNAAWFADITYVKTRQGCLYPTPVMDVWSRRIVGLVDGPQHRGRAGRQGVENGSVQAKSARRLRPSRRSRLAIRIAVSIQDHVRERHPAVDEVNLVAVGQRSHGVAHGHREVGVRARAHLRHARGGRAGSVRMH